MKRENSDRQGTLFPDEEPIAASAPQPRQLTMPSVARIVTRTKPPQKRLLDMLNNIRTVVTLEEFALKTVRLPNKELKRARVECTKLVDDVHEQFDAPRFIAEVKSLCRKQINQVM